MSLETARTITIPEGVEASIEKGVVKATGPKGQLERRLVYPHITIDKVDSSIVVDTSVQRKKQIAMIGTFASHIQNMITGVTSGFQYRLKVVYSHFPIQTKVVEGWVSIGNFLGERKSRRARILGDQTNVEIAGDEITVSGIDKEAVGQSAANIEQATRIRRRDPRVFQDGIYIVSKGEMQ